MIGGFTGQGGGGGGGGPTGDPNAVGYFDPTGANLIDNPRLVAAPQDPFGRPQFWDNRVPSGGGEGPVFRQGSWSSDGDPTDQVCAGAVYYGLSVNGILSLGEGAYARIKANRFGFFTILPGGPGAGYYQWRVDTTELYFKADGALAPRTFDITRATGSVRTAGIITPYKPGAGSVGGYGIAFGLLVGWKANLGNGWLVGLIPPGVEGDLSYCIDGRKVGEGPGLGTGVPVYWSQGAWRVYSTDLAVQA